MKFLTSSALVLALAAPGWAETYHLDPGHTEVRFSWNHAGLTEQHGEWTQVSGTIDFDPADVTATSAQITIDPDSLHTGVAALDNHLKSADFFDIETYPTITFTSTSAVQTGAQNLRLTGDLTVKDQTKPAVLDVELTFDGEHPLGGYFDYYKGDWVGVEATGTLLRSEFGVAMFAPGTSDTVQLEISAEMRAGGWE